MPDPTEPHTPPPGAGSDAARGDTTALAASPVAERGIASRRARSRTQVMARRLLAGVALTGLTELALGRRLYFAWEALQRAVRWLHESETPQQSGNPQQPMARPPPAIPTPQEAMEEVVQGVLDWTQRTVERHKPAIVRASKRVRQRLKEPRIGGAAIGGATLGAVASVGLLPAAVGAGTAYLVHRKLRSKHPSPKPSPA